MIFLLVRIVCLLRIQDTRRASSRVWDAASYERPSLHTNPVVQVVEFAFDWI